MSGADECPDFQNETCLWLVGLSCKAVSTLNNNRDMAREAIEAAARSTGETFSGVLLILERRRPRQIILESVLGLLTNNQHKLTIAALRRVGYIAVVVPSNSLDYGRPQARQRLCFLFFGKIC